jgi:hypothetical protein
MCARPKKLAVTLTMIAILLSFTLANMKFAHSSDAGGKIDLFTQKEPYSGKGLNMPSDAFGLQDIVILYALVTYNEAPIQNLLVGFNVKTPSNTSFSVTARTNSTGIATVDFAIPQKCVNVSEAFGKWFALAKALIEGKAFEDTLTFKVDWIVKLISVRTIDQNLTYRANFGIGGDVGLEISLTSVAMIVKSATIAIVIQDELNVPVNSSEIRDIKVTPNEKLVFLYSKLLIPKYAFVGKAKAIVSAFTAPLNESWVPYCPPVSTEFFIVPYEPLKITFHDVAVVDAGPSAETVEGGQPIDIVTVAQNEGTETESFNVSAYYNNVTIGTLRVTALAPYSHLTLNFTFDTSTLNPGNYTITVSIPPLVNEADITDNVFVDGIIEIKPKCPTIIHDIAIVDVRISKDTLYIGELLHINISVVNEGTETETFNVTTYYDSSLIETLQVSTLAPNVRATLIFVWNTSSVKEGFYQISASAGPVPGEIDVSDNWRPDGIVQVKARPPLPPIHDVAVLNVSPSKTLVYMGEIVNIYVVTKNEGSYVESFDVTAFYNSSVIGRLLVKGLQPGSEMLLVFYWNTRNAAEGNYTLSAEASVVPGEVAPYTDNNKLVDGVVWVKSWAFPPVWEIPRWLLALLFISAILIGACLAAAIVFVLLRRRKRKRKDQWGRQPSSFEVEPCKEVGFKRSKTCSACGKEFPGVYTFCPYCFTFHGKDYE